jgi:hypothetical protein
MAAAAAVSWTPVNPGDAQAAAVLAEIDTYLFGRREIFAWLHSVRALLGGVNGELYQAYLPEFTFVRTSQIDKLPDQDALKRYNGIWTLSTAYDSRPFAPQNRGAMLPGVANLLLTIRRLQHKIMTDKRVPTGQARNNCKVAYEGARTQLQNWVLMARAHVLPSLQPLRRREEAHVRKFPHHAHMQKVQALLDELHALR